MHCKEDKKRIPQWGDKRRRGWEEDMRRGSTKKVHAQKWSAGKIVLQKSKRAWEMEASAGLNAQAKPRAHRRDRSMDRSQGAGTVV
jgi:hypothetical protein